MDKTIRELAEQYGMSKQAIQYHIKKLPKEVTNFDTKNGTKILLVNDKGQDMLEEILTNKVVKEPTNFGGKEFVGVKHQLELAEQEIKHLQGQLDDKTQQIQILNQRLEEAHKLVDQAQRLQGIAEQKILALEQKEMAAEQTPEQKSWWQFWK